MPSITTVARHLGAAPLLLSLLLLSGATARPPLTPGSWTFTNTPGAASLDGRPLHDLPVSESTSETVCLTPELAARPAEWLARDLVNDCTLERRDVAAGHIAITGQCPPRSPGFAPGRLSISGSYSATSYDLTFKTVSLDENGTMAFDGRMVGRRTGSCAAGS